MVEDEEYKNNEEDLIDRAIKHRESQKSLEIKMYDYFKEKNK